MAKRLITLMAALLVLAFVVAGCGDDESSNDTGDTAAQTVTDTDTVTEDEVVTDEEVVTDTETATETETVTDQTDTDAAGDDGGGGATVPQNREQAVASCRRAVTSYPKISEDAKSDLVDLCVQAASGDAKQARQARREVCETLVDEVYPSGMPGKAKALEACQSSIK